jgi:hypothetical protein
MFEKRMLRRIFGLKTDEIIGGRNLHEEFHNMYSSPNIIRMIKSKVWDYQNMGEKRNAYRVYVGKPEGKRQQRRPRREWEIILKWVLEKYNGDMNWIHLIQDRDQWRVLVNTVMSSQVP